MLLIDCPCCGARPEDEFGFGGDAAVRHPNEAGAGEPPATADFVDYLYLRDNPKGWHSEFWVHRYGCRRWLVVERHTVTHEIRSVRLAAAGGEQ